MDHDPHAEGGAEPCDPRPDPAEADHEDTPSAQLEGARLAMDAPLPAPHRGRHRHDSPGEGQHQHQRVLGDRCGIGFGRDHQRDAAPRQGRHIDQVVANSMAANDAQPFRVHEQRVVHFRAANDQAIGIAQPLLERHVRRVARVIERDTGDREQAVNAALVNGIGDDDTHWLAFPPDDDKSLCPGHTRSASDRLVAGRRLGYRWPEFVPCKPAFVGSSAMSVAVATATRPLSPLDHERSMREYGQRAEARAYALGNRGPIRVGADGKLLPEILELYWAHGFYVFQGVVGPEELQELRADIDEVLSRAPVAPDATVDQRGRATLDHGIIKPPYRWAKPLSDPVGGTDKNNGRHPAAMLQPEPPKDSPDWTVELLDGNLHLSDACLRLYGHPGLLPWRHRSSATISSPTMK